MTDEAPLITITSGEPTEQETAAVVVVLSAVSTRAAARAAAQRGSRPAAPSQWAARSRLLRAPVTPGPGLWRASALPR